MIIRIFITVCDLIVPLIVILLSRVFKKAPKKINNYSGYRTRLSMRNEDTWKYAHEIAGKIWLKGGIIMLIISVIAVVISGFFNKDVMGFFCMGIVTVQAVSLLFFMKPVENALKKEFTDDGERRQ